MTTTAPQPRVRFPEVHRSYTYGEQVGMEVRALCARRHVTGRQLAEVLGLSAVAVSRRLTGETAFNVDELAILAEAFGLPVSELLPPPPLPHRDSNTEPAGYQVTGRGRGMTSELRAPSSVSDLDVDYQTEAA